MKKVVFVCGMGGGKRDLFVMRKLLKEFDWIYFPYDSRLKEPIESIAYQLDTFVNKIRLRKNEKMSIVAFSAGGIISEYYLKYINHKKVDNFVTVCSPFKGTWLAYFSGALLKTHEGFTQLRIGSPLLKQLKKRPLEGIREKNIYCFFDPIVQGTSGRGVHPEHTLFFLHWFIQWYPPTSYRIRAFLNRSLD